MIRNKSGKAVIPFAITVDPERTDETLCLTSTMPAWDGTDHAPCRIVFKRLRAVREQARATK